MRHSLALPFVLLTSVGTGMAQGSARGSDDVQVAIGKRDWQRALEVVDQRGRRARSAALHDEVAKQYAQIGDGAYRDGKLESALRGWQGCLTHVRAAFGADALGVIGSETWVGKCLAESGRQAEALPFFERALAIVKRVTPDDAITMASARGNLGFCLQALGRLDEAMTQFETALKPLRAMRKLPDHQSVAVLLNNHATLLEERSRFEEARDGFLEAIEMFERLGAGVDERKVSECRSNFARLATTMGTSAKALPAFERLLRDARGKHGGRDHEDVAVQLNNVAFCQDALGDTAAAVRMFEEALAMRQRLAAGQDDVAVAQSLHNLGSVSSRQGRLADALERYEAAMAMRQRLFEDRPAPDLAISHQGVGNCLRLLGEPGRALEQMRAAVAMWTRLHGDRDILEVAVCRVGAAACLLALDRAAEARTELDAALPMLARVVQDHPDRASALNFCGDCSRQLGRFEEAVQQHEAALAMQQRLFGKRPHPDLADTRASIASCRLAAGDAKAALVDATAALASYRRCFGNDDRVSVARCITTIGLCHQHLDRAKEAEQSLAASVAMLERLFAGNRGMSDELRCSLFDELKRGSAFEALQRALVAAGRPEGAFAIAERCRSRVLFEQLTGSGTDPLDELVQRAEARRDAKTAAALRQLRKDLDDVQVEIDRRTRELLVTEATERERAELEAALDDAIARRLKLHGTRANVIAEVAPAATVRTLAEIRRCLRNDELLLEYTLSPGAAMVFVVSAQEPVRVFDLGSDGRLLDKELLALQADLGRSKAPVRGRDAEGDASSGSDGARRSNMVFRGLVPAEVWTRLRRARCVFVAAHRRLHQVPFEVLVTEIAGGRAVSWLESGPPISYVPSASALHWLRRRPAPPKVDGPGSLLVVGDPAPIRTAATGGAAPAAPQRSWPPERLRELPPLAGARAEAEAIAASWAERGGAAKLLLGDAATETAVFAAAANAQCLHFACHGLAVELGGRSAGFLVLGPSPPDAADDGFLSVTDLLQRWRGRLDRCRLVVLSACRTNFGPTGRDDAPQALPIGFLFAGASSVVASHWPVDDASTRALMTDFHRRLSAGGADRLAAFTAARRELLRQYPSPFHWAPFCFFGLPD